MFTDWNKPHPVSCLACLVGRQAAGWLSKGEGGMFYDKVEKVISEYQFWRIKE